MNILGLVLAAGESSRLGQKKQLVRYQGEYLLARTIKQLETLLPTVHVVLGASHANIQQQIHIEHPIINPDWPLGMGHSLATGIQHLPPCDAVLIALCDQYLIPDSHYQALVQAAHKHSNRIIATEHQSVGVPAVFPQQQFNALIELTGQQGAKSIIKQHNNLTIACPEAAFDVDTPEDLSKHLL